MGTVPSIGAKKKLFFLLITPLLGTFYQALLIPAKIFLLAGGLG
jgi:hypothetical protein